MKRNRFFLLIAMLPALQVVQAQTSYEATALLDTDLSGTARYVGMGGAMSALGADMSTMNTNPAGTALYRRWDAALSFGSNWVTQRTQSNLQRNRSFSSHGSFDNMGVVVANKISNTNALRFVNFGVNYRNVKRFGGKMGLSAKLGGLSQTNQMLRQACELVDYTYFDPESDNNLYDNNYFGFDSYGWLTLLGAYADLIKIHADRDEAGNIQYDGMGNVMETYWDMESDSYNYSEVLSGGIDAYDFNLSFNLIDAVYLGVTLTAYDVDRALESTYSENFYGSGGYTLQSFYRTVGKGYDLGFGAIVRPFPESSFRIGVSATTPTVYTLHDYNSAIISSCIYTEDVWYEYEMDTQNEDAFGGDCRTDYTMIAPAKVNVSLGGTIGTSLALGAEYEYMNYGCIALYDSYGNDNVGMNEHTESSFTGKHTLRLGAEKTFGSFYTRLGYNFQTGGYMNSSYKTFPINSVQTNTAYANIKSTQNFTCGLGFRGDAFYVDAALLYSTQNADFYPFDDVDLQATKLNRNLIKGMMTIGMKF